MTDIPAPSSGRRMPNQERLAGGRAVTSALQVLDGQVRALSVRRPWANLIIAGHKSVENRSWSTAYRGDLCVHGGLAWESDGVALAAELKLVGFDDRTLCCGGYLGMVRLVDVHPAADCCAPWGEACQRFFKSDPLWFSEN